ncbi:2-oxo acid dehydrogenase subunit E2 [Bermanella marisrubri]|uniref:Dihydrolipoamide acetyltransferase component of pyruvate dehydrogenase complex n=1 Tax=Bermanella marisrubri TaxID=207949 RepID=Q1MYF5_9GAMM|nr:dihydrolipoamide acetyltransferase family protein [Bermanella marisrubri]EAT10990.1 dihydrolipoamide acetyltransferase [Oceanobacter sp. RED65] [Bermanella marisrubri]QIZ83765.1 2-oxo acid dehydrogenase subunit E2 [Bermanella marisrubri]
MKYFKLPDLGEGLHEAEIVEWHIKPGDQVAVDQLMVSVETAKAIVEVPSPQAGVVAAFFAEEGDTVHVGEALVEYEGEEDSGTVVGDLSKAPQGNSEQGFIVGSAYDPANSGANASVKATPSVRALAKRLGVDLSHLKPSGGDGRFTIEDVEKAAALNDEKGRSEVLKGVRKSMAKAMADSHANVVPVTLHDDVDIHQWKEGQDVTMRLVHAIAYACEVQPELNVWFDGEQMTRRMLNQVDLGIAVDTEQGLFVPVLRDIRNRNMFDLRDGLNALRQAVKERKIPPQEMQGASITLSNFGTLAGKYANPVVVPPMVAIVGAGGIRREAVVWEGEVCAHAIIPLSLTFDHRAATGGEAARFLKAMMQDLAKPEI